jgi:hypothetical protein
MALCHKLTLVTNKQRNCNMEKTTELLLIAGMIIISIFSIKFSHDSMVAIERMNNQIQMMFVKS